MHHESSVLAVKNRSPVNHLEEYSDNLTNTRDSGCGSLAPKKLD
jgi:hypothetical protein